VATQHMKFPEQFLLFWNLHAKHCDHKCRP